MLHKAHSASGFCRGSWVKRRLTSSSSWGCIWPGRPWGWVCRGSCQTGGGSPSGNAERKTKQRRSLISNLYKADMERLLLLRILLPCDLKLWYWNATVKPKFQAAISKWSCLIKWVLGVIIDPGCEGECSQKKNPIFFLLFMLKNIGLRLQQVLMLNSDFVLKSNYFASSFIPLIEPGSNEISVWLF